MISEALLSRWRADKQWWIWFIAGLVILGVLSFFEKGDWQLALRAPLAIITFISVTLVIADFSIWLFGKGKLGKFWLIMLVIAALLLSLLSLLINPVFLVLFSFLTSCVLLIIGVFKSVLYKRFEKKR